MISATPARSRRRITARNATLYGGTSEAGDAEDEGLVALVAEPSSRFAASASVRATIDPGHAHDVELEPGSIEALDLLVTRTSTLPPWCPHFLAPGFWSSMW